MPDAPDWSAREAQARAALSALDPLLGAWEGEVVAHGERFTARLDARRILLGSAVETRERLYDADGVLDYEDLALYRHEPDRGLFVQHLQPPGWSSEAQVEVVPGGLIWSAGPTEPRVEIAPRGDGLLRVAVWFPFQPEPASEGTYRRVESPSEAP